MHVYMHGMHTMIDKLFENIITSYTTSTYCIYRCGIICIHAPRSGEL